MYFRLVLLDLSTVDLVAVMQMILAQILGMQHNQENPILVLV